MSRADDLAAVVGFLRWMRDVDMGDPVRNEQRDRALVGAERLHEGSLRDQHATTSPVVLQLRAADEVTSIRKCAVGAGWFEVPGGAWEQLRMIDSATGNHLIVYNSKRGFKAVANVGHPAAQTLLQQWRKSR